VDQKGLKMIFDETRVISSQRYRDPEIVERKKIEKDYLVTVVSITVDGEDFFVVVDGHHSYDAALENEDFPIWDIIEDKEYENMDVDDWLEQKWIDDNYYFLVSGLYVWQ